MEKGISAYRMPSHRLRDFLVGFVESEQSSLDASFSYKLRMSLHDGHVVLDLIELD
jgi:hypothetical protein